MSLSRIQIKSIRQNQQSSSSPLPVSAGLTIRAISVGLILSVLLNIWGIHSSYVTNASIVSLAHLPITAVFPFVLVVFGLNPLIKWILPGKGFTRQELIIVFFLVFTASAIPAWAFSSYALSVISGPNYFVSPENRWAELFLSSVPSWLIVPNTDNALTPFFEGLGSGDTAVWQVWIIPLFWWLTFYAAIFIVGASLMVILRKQWVEHERLSFPLAQVPLLLIEGTDGPSLWPPIVRSPLFWMGFGITFFILLWNMIGYFGYLPTIRIGPTHATGLVLFDKAPNISIRFNYLVAGIAYFTRIEVLFSVWFFYLLRIIQEGMMNNMGVANSYMVLQFQHLGGLLTMVVFTLWMARRHLKQVFYHALGRPSDLDDSREFFPYRLAVFGVTGGYLYLVAWLYAAGGSLVLIIVMITMSLLIFVGISRVVAETGLAAFDIPYDAANRVTVVVVGTDHIDAQTLTTMTLCHTFARNWRTLGMCSMAHAAKMGDVMGGGVGKGVFGMITLTLVLSTATAFVYTIYLGYDFGASQFTGTAFKRGAQEVWDELAGWINNAHPYKSTHVIYSSSGILVMFFLLIVHHRFTWWPLHPIGFGVVATHSVNMAVANFFFVWLVKVVIFRVGGVALYRTVQPLVIGMIVAYATGVFISFVVDLIWFPANGHQIHSF